ncbi:MAG: spermidine/putrescine ABC transporter substrate-binding protein [Gammaproteobacteria bacterium]|nr:spermidine/putrescine ABC transporter substrate-binding protein [Gammaproteobacteria bacterium]
MSTGNTAVGNIAKRQQRTLKRNVTRRAASIFLAIFSFFFVSAVSATEDNVVNVYAWSQELPSSLLTQFEKETGIHVNLASFDSNEVLYSKLRTGKNPGYDIVEPSSYYVERMRHQNMLIPLDRSKLPNMKNLDPWFFQQSYDPGSQYSIPLIWGITGIFTNQHYFPQTEITQWSDLLKKRYHNQLMILDDPREAFSMALLMLGYSINDTDPSHIHQAWLKLRELMPNVKLFNTDAVKSILIDEDALIGLAWNGDLVSALPENQNLAFVIPTGKFEIWVDSFVILKSAPHKENAYKFLNYMMRAEAARAVSLEIGYATANLAARNTLPDKIRNNPSLYPPPAVLRRGEFQTDVGDKTFALYEKYWEKLKMGV